MRISRLAERSGGAATTLRSSEGAGLLPADRTPAGYRLYGEAAVERLAFIGAAKHLGLPLEEIGELLGVRESGACGLGAGCAARSREPVRSRVRLPRRAVRDRGRLAGLAGHP
nr:MerR family transcriptional regulator [Streptomyces californicus]